MNTKNVGGVAKIERLKLSETEGERIFSVAWKLMICMLALSERHVRLFWYEVAVSGNSRESRDYSKEMASDAYLWPRHTAKRAVSEQDNQAMRLARSTLSTMARDSGIN